MIREGAFICIKITSDLKQRLEEIARRESRSLSGQIKYFVNRGLQGTAPEDKRRLEETV